jgi:hypothetical protein
METNLIEQSACAEFEALLLEREWLEANERYKLAKHLEECPECRDKERLIGEFGDVFRVSPAGNATNLGIVASVMQKIERTENHRDSRKDVRIMIAALLVAFSEAILILLIRDGIPSIPLLASVFEQILPSLIGGVTAFTTGISEFSTGIAGIGERIGATGHGVVALFVLACLLFMAIAGKETIRIIGHEHH